MSGTIAPGAGTLRQLRYGVDEVRGERSTAQGNTRDAASHSCPPLSTEEATLRLPTLVEVEVEILGKTKASARISANWGLRIPRRPLFRSHSAATQRRPGSELRWKRRNVLHAATTGFRSPTNTTWRPNPTEHLRYLESPAAAMAKRKNRERGEADLKLKQPDRTGPSEKTLLELAQERQLFQQADEKIRANARRPRRQRGREQGEGREKGDEDGAAGLSPLAEQLLETVLWTVSLAMLHFTLDTLVQHQYAVDISWPGVAARAAQAFFGMPPRGPRVPFPPLRSQRLTSRRQLSSLLPPLLQPPPARLRPDPDPRPAGPPAETPAAGRLLRRQRMRRLLPDLRHEPPRLPGRHAPRAAAGLPVDLVRHRARAAARRAQSRMRRGVHVARWIRRTIG